MARTLNADVGEGDVGDVARPALHDPNAAVRVLWCDVMWCGVGWGGKRTQMVMSSNAMLNMSSSVLDPNLSALERDRTVQFTTLTFDTTPYPSVDLRQMPARVTNANGSARAPSSATSTYALRITTSRDESGSMPSLLGLRCMSSRQQLRNHTPLGVAEHGDAVDDDVVAAKVV